MSSTIVKARDPRRFAQFYFFFDGVFSQWHPSPIVIDGQRYSCAEQYMMAEKARTFNDTLALHRIMATENPAEQKRIGRTVMGYSDDRWHPLRAQQAVRRATRAKFLQHPQMRWELLQTRGCLLVEASPTDCLWGIGLSEWDEDRHDVAKWRGTNWLGWIVTEYRESILPRE